MTGHLYFIRGTLYLILYYLHHISDTSMECMFFNFSHTIEPTWLLWKSSCISTSTYVHTHLLLRNTHFTQFIHIRVVINKLSIRMLIFSKYPSPCVKLPATIKLHLMSLEKPSNFDCSEQF
jgi:hypothetical protein